MTKSISQGDVRGKNKEKIKKGETMKKDRKKNRNQSKEISDKELDPDSINTVTDESQIPVDEMEVEKEVHGEIGEQEDELVNKKNDEFKMKDKTEKHGDESGDMSVQKPKLKKKYKEKKKDGIKQGFGDKATDMEVDTDVNNKFITSVQKERLDRKKQKRREKRQKMKANTLQTETKRTSNTENVLWKKLKQVQRHTEQTELVPETPVVCETEEDDPVKKAIREKKRQKRKQKKLEKLKVRQENEDRAGTAGPASIEYLHLWENNREEWKFMKVRQVWLLMNMYNMEQINDEDFKILLRYLEPTSNKIKESLVKEAEEIITNIELEHEENNEEGADVTVINYKMDRARQIIQLLAV